MAGWLNKLSHPWLQLPVNAASNALFITERGKASSCQLFPVRHRVIAGIQAKNNVKSFTTFPHSSVTHQ